MITPFGENELCTQYVSAFIITKTIANKTAFFPDMSNADIQENLFELQVRTLPLYQLVIEGALRANNIVFTSEIADAWLYLVFPVSPGHGCIDRILAIATGAVPNSLAHLRGRLRLSLPVSITNRSDDVLSADDEYHTNLDCTMYTVLPRDHPDATAVRDLQRVPTPYLL